MNVKTAPLRFIENLLKCATAIFATWRQRTLYDNNCFIILYFVSVKVEQNGVPWEQNIRYIYLPSLQLSIIMWLSHLLTSFSLQRNRYLFPKYRVTHIWAERFRYGICHQFINNHDINCMCLFYYNFHTKNRNRRW
jgi:hypothetical protein